MKLLTKCYCLLTQVTCLNSELHLFSLYILDFQDHSYLSNPANHICSWPITSYPFLWEQWSSYPCTPPIFLILRFTYFSHNSRSSVHRDILVLYVYNEQKWAILCTNSGLYIRNIVYATFSLIWVHVDMWGCTWTCTNVCTYLLWQNDETNQAKWKWLEKVLMSELGNQFFCILKEAT